MRERLATRPEITQEVKPSEAPMDPAFEDIIANYDQEVEHRNAGAVEGESLSDSEQATLNAMEQNLGTIDTSKVHDADMDSPSALAPAPTTAPPPTPTKPVPTTPTPAPTVPAPTPVPTPPESRVRINMDSETAPPDMPPPEAPTLPPTDRREPGETGTPEALKMVLVDQSFDAKQAARDAAEARLNQELQQGGKFKRFVKGFWKGNAFKSYYRNKYQRQAEAVINESQDVLAHDNSPAAARARATQALLERFGLENEEAINTAAGEKQNILAGNSPMAIEAKTLLRRYVNGELNDQAFQEQRREFASRHGGEVTADNMFEIAQTLKGVVEHGESLDNALENMKIISGESRSEARTQARLTLTERFIDRAEKSKWGSMIPKGVLGAGASIAGSVLRLGSDKAIRAVLMTATFGTSSAVISALVERKRVKDERAQHTREMVMGGEVQSAPAPLNRRQRILRKLFPNRREQLEQARVESVSANDLTNTMRERMATLALDDADLPPGMTREAALRAALDALTAAETQNLITDTTQNEVLGFSSRTAARDERLQLALARAELKVALRNQMDDATRAQIATELGLPADSNLEAIVKKQGVGIIEAVNQEATEKDRVFNKLARKRMLTTGVITLVAGATLGALAQEVMAATPGIGNQRVGVFENGGPNTVYEDGREHQTVLRGLFNGDREPTHTGPSANFRETSVGDNGTWSVTDDHKMVKNSDGTYNLVDPNGKATVENMKVNPDGTMPQETRDLLESKGMTVEDDPTIIKGETHLEPQTVTAEQHLANHAAEAPPMEVDNWMVNADPDDSDKNELKLQWTGTGIVHEPDGTTTYHMNVANMAENGSYNGEQNINWKEEAKNGNLTLRVKPLENSPQAFIVPIAPDGSITVSGEAAKYFSEKNGQPSVSGHWAQVSRLNGIDANGVHHVDSLATAIGTHEASTQPIQDMVPVTEPDTVYPGYKITTDGYDTPGTYTEMAPFIPVRSRRSLEVLGRRTPVPERPGSPERPYAAYGEYGLLTPEIIRRMEEDRMPELKRDPKARISLKDGLDWHYSLKMRKDPAYVNSVQGILGKLGRFTSSLNNSTQAIAPILVKANGEEDNIYHTLSLYARQDPDKLKATQILLHVNYLDSAANDPVEKARIDKTYSEIQRALDDFPQLRTQLSQFESIWEKDKLDAGEYGDRLIGHAAQRMYDVAMFGVREAINNGNMDPDHDVLILKGDADALGMSRKYLDNMIDTFEAHPENDTFTGGVRWGTELSTDLPGLGFLTNFIEINRIAAQRAHIQAFQPTFGVNAAVRMSTFGAVGGVGHYADQTESAPDDLAIGERIASARNATPAAVASTGTAGYGAGVAGVLGDDHSYHRHVGGASIDTAADRFEAKYVNGESITTIWDKVNQGGHQDRRMGLKKGEKEDLKKKPLEVIGRIERNMSELITNWFPNEAQNAAALAVMLPGPDQLGGAPAYEIIRRPDGSKKFSLSPEGRKWLIHRLQYHGNGRRDPYGERQARQLYNRRPRGRQRQSRVRFRKDRTAPMVGGLAFTS